MWRTLLKPAFFSWKNRIRSSLDQHLFANSNIIVLLSASIIIFTTYFISLNFFQGIFLDSNVRDVIPRFFFSAVFFSSFILLFISGAVNSFQTFFLAADLPLLHISPVKSYPFFLARIITTTINSSWMLLLLLLPIIFSYQVAFGSPLLTWIYTLCLLVPIILIPCLLSFGACLGFLCIASLQNAKLFFGIFALVTLCSIFYYLPSLYEGAPLYSISGDAASVNSDALLKIFSKELTPNWFYTSIAARYFTEATTHSLIINSLHLALIWSIALSLFTLCYLAFRTFYKNAWSHSLENPIQSEKTLAIFNKTKFYPLMKNRPLAGIAKKELKLFLRDLSQSLQFFMLLLITLIYIYNFRALREPTSSSVLAVNSWQTLLLISNLALGAFVIAAIGARFIFPSVNLEGKSFILLKSAPVSTAQVIKYKFITWFIPSVFLLNLLFLSGELAIGANYSVMLTGAVIACSLSLTIAALGISLGSINLNFSWNSPSEIFNSSGAIAYMCSCFGVISLTIGLGAFPLALSVFGPIESLSTTQQFGVYFICFYIMAMTSIEFTHTLLRTSAKQLDLIESY